MAQAVAHNIATLISKLSKSFISSGSCVTQLPGVWGVVFALISQSFFFFLTSSALNNKAWRQPDRAPCYVIHSRHRKSWENHFLFENLIVEVEWNKRGRQESAVSEFSLQDDLKLSFFLPSNPSSHFHTFPWNTAFKQNALHRHSAHTEWKKACENVFAILLYLWIGLK